MRSQPICVPLVLSQPALSLLGFRCVMFSTRPFWRIVVLFFDRRLLTVLLDAVAFRVGFFVWRLLPLGHFVFLGIYVCSLPSRRSAPPFLLCFCFFRLVFISPFLLYCFFHSLSDTLLINVICILFDTLSFGALFLAAQHSFDSLYVCCRFLVGRLSLFVWFRFFILLLLLSASCYPTW